MSEDLVKAAFRKGVESSRKADALRAEAERTIQEFADKIAEVSGNTITVSLDETWIEKTNRLVSQAVVSLMGPLVPERKKTHAIFAQVQGWDASPRINLCIVTFARDIFPIELRWETEALVCSDGNELAMGLVALVEDPRTGKKFRQLMAKREAIKELPSAGNEGAPQT